MELRQLKYFEAVARHLNFSRTAEELFIAQPPLSKQIQKLEEELDVELIDRSKRPMKLTKAGCYFYEQASQIILRLHEIKKSTQRLGAENREWVRVGFVPSVLYGAVPTVIQQFSSEHEEIEVSLIELVTAEQEAALKSGRIDIGFGRLAVEDDFVKNIVLKDEPIIAAVSSTSSLAKNKNVSLNEILEEVLILYPSTPHPNFSDQIIRQFKIRGLEISKTYETNGLQTAIGMVAAGVGIALVPRSVQAFQRAEVIYLPLKEEGITSPLLMSMRINENSSHVLNFRNRVISAYEKLISGKTNK